METDKIKDVKNQSLFYTKIQIKAEKFVFTTLTFLLFAGLLGQVAATEDDNPVQLPTNCEVCKFLVRELQMRLDETGKNREVLRTGHGLDRNKKQIEYKYSELRLIEALENPHVCDRILLYNLHKEREGSRKYEKGMSETMQTLHGLVNKGVKVDLGIPEELWDKPSAEITDMQRRCFKLVEDYEDDIDDWYKHHQDEDLADFLCRKRVLTSDNTACLSEVYSPKGEDDANSDSSDKNTEDQNVQKKKKKKNKLKGETGEKTESTDSNKPKTEL